MTRSAKSTMALETTIPPSSANVMETRTPLLIQDRKSTKVSAGHLYGFMIIFNEVEDNIRLLSPGEAGFTEDSLHPIAPFEYFFTVPPKAVHVSEPATVQIQPTIGRNYIIEHQGSLLKELTISGTTGFRPNAGFEPAGAVRGFSQVFGRTTRAVSNVLGAFGELVGNPNFPFDARGIPPAEPTGYFNFMQLRNVFRRYFSLRSGAALERGKVPLMLWVNFHEFEFWVCEPTAFSTRRDSNSPLTFSYDISATLLVKADSTQLRSLDWYQSLVETQLPWDYVLDTVTGLNNLARTILEVPEAAVGDLVGIANEFSSVIIDTANTIGEVVRAGRGLSGIAAGISDRQLALLGSRSRDAAQAWDDGLAGVNGTRNRYLFFERGNNFKESLRIANRLRVARRDQHTSGGGVGSGNALLQQNQRAYGGSSPGPGSPRASDAANSPRNWNRNYGESGDVRNVRGLGQSPLNRDRVQGGEDIRGVAQRVLGAASRWKELVILNGLVFPYISPVGGQGVLKPGDEILIPGGIDSDNDNLVLPTAAEAFGANVAEIQPEDIVFGRDLKISFTGDNDAGNLKIDLATTPGGDIALIAGRANFEQALVLLTNTERGALRLHPFYGFPRLVGRRISHSTAALWSVEAKQALLGDPRISVISDIGVGVIGDTFVGRIDVVSRRSLARVPITTVQRI